jgi:hypothetical protein
MCIAHRQKEAAARYTDLVLLPLRVPLKRQKTFADKSCADLLRKSVIRVKFT